MPNIDKQKELIVLTDDQMLTIKGGANKTGAGSSSEVD